MVHTNSDAVIVKKKVGVVRPIPVITEGTWTSISSKKINHLKKNYLYVKMNGKGEELFGRTG